MKEILLIGMYGSGSAGDDAILQSIVEAFPEYKITITQGRYFDAAKLFGVRSILLRMYEGFSFPIFFSVLLSSFKIFFRLIHSSILVFGGGSLIHDLSFYNLPFFFFWHAFALIFKKPVVYFSIGIGPVQTKLGRRLCKFFLSRATFLFVRDKRGKEICDTLGVNNAILSHDAVFLRAGKVSPDQMLLSKLYLKEQKYIALTGCAWFHTDNYWSGKKNFDQEVKNFAECLRIVHQAINLPLVYITVNKHDYALGKQLQTYFAEDAFVLLPETLNCVEIQQVFAGCAITFGVRMHSIIFTANACHPFFCVIYDEKVTQLLSQLGTIQYSMPIEHMCPQALSPLFNTFLKDQAEIADKLRENVPAFQSDLQKCVDLIRGCIKT